MTKLTVVQVAEAAAELTEAEMLSLNKLLCEMIRTRRRTSAAVLGTQFRPGQIVRFNAKTRGMKMIKIEKFNRAGTCVVGRECDAQGFQTAFAVKWTVANGLCTLVEAK